MKEDNNNSIIVLTIIIMVIIYQRRKKEEKVRNNNLHTKYMCVEKIQNVPRLGTALILGQVIFIN